MNDAFQLDERLAADSLELLDGPLSLIRLMNDANYPWLVLVPRRPGLRDFHDLDPADLPAMTREIVAASRVLEDSFAPIKINVAALGNQVPQLHVHVIARSESDAAWPKPIWGAVPALAYEVDTLAARREDLRARLAERLSA